MSDIKEDAEWVMNMAKWAEDEYPHPTEHNEALAAIQRVEALLESTRWIPCTERMPELGERVLVWNSTRKCVVSDRRMLSYDGSRWYWGGGSMDVTHWQPLPKGPEVPE